MRDTSSPIRLRKLASGFLEVNTYFENSGYELKDEFDKYNAKIVYKDILPTHEVKENKACKCPEILKALFSFTRCYAKYLNDSKTVQRKKSQFRNRV